MEGLESIQKDAQKELEKISNLKDLEAFELEFLGRKKGRLTAVLRSLGTLSDTEKRKVGPKAQILRKDLEGAIKEKKSSLKRGDIDSRLEKEKIDITYPGLKDPRGHLHPITKVRREVENIFGAMGFEVASGPYIETDFYNFDALNIPEEHPARDMWDTFWLKGMTYALRPHTSPVQIHYMEKHNPPFRIIAPGRVFRQEATDASHDFDFWQLEGLMVGKNVSVKDLKYVLETFMSKFFGKKVKLRLRPSFFPFVEPGFEVDISCVACVAKGCSVCQKTGWLELLGAGMVHQNVFAAAGYVRGEYTGFAFGVGLDRLALMKYKIPDVRHLRTSDIRFLKQF
ncbi:MAG: phenylalanine--tRNA ligase subunit alpha [bacterium]|nr:phenylalanine--tRNA ligase subunit alpha [bacterium]